MKKYPKAKGVVKGLPSGFVISLLVHAAAFMLAGLLVVFTVHQKEEKKFVPPKPVERPKMKLKKPKVKVKKTAKPRSSNRIVTKVKRANMPDIQLPEMSGIGEGLGSGMGDVLDLMPDLEEVTIFGSGQTIGNDLEGVFYDFKRFRNGRNNNAYDLSSYVEKFIRSGWKLSSLFQFYRSPRKLYTPMIMVPPTESSLGPWAFGEREMDPWSYMVHYKGQLVHKDGIKFRFVVMGDNYLLIRLNGKVIMDYKNQFEAAVPGPPFKPMSYHLGHWYAYASDWVELEPGESQDIEMIMGDYSGGLFSAMVAIEEYGVNYPNAPTPQDNPQLPIFKTASLTLDQVDAIYRQMWEGHLQVTNGPVFSDYDSEDKGGAVAVPKAPVEPEPVVPVSSSMRVWTLNNGKNVEGQYVNIMSGNAVLKTTHGKTVKVPLSDFSPDDLSVLELLNPPNLKMSIKKDADTSLVRSNPDSTMAVPAATDFSAKVVIEQQDIKNNYQRPLRLEFYVIMDEYDGNNFILFDRQTEIFTLSPENNWRFELHGNENTIMRYEDYGGVVRGEKYKGYMILVFNEKDELIAQNLSHDWLLDIRDKLSRFPVGRHFNKQGERVFPPRPKFTDRFWEHAP